MTTLPVIARPSAGPGKLVGRQHSKTGRAIALHEGGLLLLESPPA